MVGYHCSCEVLHFLSELLCRVYYKNFRKFQIDQQTHTQQISKYLEGSIIYIMLWQEIVSKIINIAYTEVYSITSQYVLTVLFIVCSR